MTNWKKSALSPGLYLVATPIGNARDITLRAMDVLASADVLLSEDTRNLRRLLELCAIPLEGRPVLAYHDHNGDRMRPRIIGAIAEGKSVACTSDAGTPLISDPGFDLVRAAHAAGGHVTTLPGPSAVIAALSLAGLPTDRFLFAGFLPGARAARARALAALADVPATLVCYESPKRLAAMLQDAIVACGPDRDAAVCRELTKKFEECRRDRLGNLAAHYAEHAPRGEIVVLIGKGRSTKISEVDLDDAIREALRQASVRDVADQLSRRFGLKRRDVYQRAMGLARPDAPET